MVTSVPFPSQINADDVVSIEAKNRLTKPYGLRKDTGGKMQSQSVYGGRTFHTTFLLPQSFYAVQCYLFNANNSGQSITGFKAGFCTSANASNVYLPSDGVTAFKNFTFQDAAIPPVFAGNANNFQNFVPGYVASDVMYFDVPPAHIQSDGSVIGMLRNYAPTLNTGANFEDSTYAGRTVSIRGESITADGFIGGNATGDVVNASGTFTRLVAGAPIEPVTGAFALKFFYDKPQLSIMAVGDSTFEGVGSTSGVSPSTRYAIQYMNKIGKAFNFFNSGFGGSSNAESPTTVTGQTPVLQYGFLPRFKRFLEIGLVPDIAVYLSLSSNNSGFKTEGTAYTADAPREAAYYTQVFIALCNQYGVQPYVLTPGPNPDITTAQEETYRRAAVEAVKDVCSGGRAVLIDRDALFTDYSNPLGGFKNPSDSRNNSVHPSDQGYLKEAELFIDEFLKVA